MKKLLILIIATLILCCSCTLQDIQKVNDTTDVITEPEVKITEPYSDAKAYKVKRVVDGDTLIVLDGDDEMRVRMIGIDTPESVSSDSSKNCSYGTVASTYTKNLLSDREVILEFDKEKTDIYDRTLAYVYVDGDMVNYTLVSNGYAVAKAYPPNTKYAEIFEKAQIKAQNKEIGMWSESVSYEDCNLKYEYYIE